MKQKIENILGKEKIADLVKAYEKTSNKFAARIFFDKEKNQFLVEDLQERLDINDVVYFEENRNLQKAVVTAKGKHGVTARDSKQDRLRIRYKNIIDYRKR